MHKNNKYVCIEVARKLWTKINKSLQLQSILVRKYIFLKNYITSEETVSQNVLYYQQLSVTHHQVSFYADNILEWEKFLKHYKIKNCCL